MLPLLVIIGLATVIRMVQLDSVDVELVSMIIAVLVGAMAGLIADTAGTGFAAAVGIGVVVAVVALAIIVVLVVRHVRRTWGPAPRSGFRRGCSGIGRS